MLRAACAAVTGGSHVEGNIGCQDAVRVVNHRNRAAIALADGAGSRRHSGMGAAVTVHSITTLLTKNFESLYARIENSDCELRAEIIESIRREIDSNAARLSETADQFASTMLFFATDRSRFIAGHLGDGVIAIRDAGKLTTLSGPDNGEFANFTFFTTDRDASERLRIYYGRISSQFGVVLMSDGAAESLYDRRSNRTSEGVARLFDIFGGVTQSYMRRVLKQNLHRVIAPRTSDDCSLAMLVCTARKGLR